jgi:hypothetical protein
VLVSVLLHVTEGEGADDIALEVSQSDALFSLKMVILLWFSLCSVLSSKKYINPKTGAFKT